MAVSFFGVRRFAAAFFCFSVFFIPKKDRKTKESGGKTPHSKEKHAMSHGPVQY
jgi:hypothetical protein